MVGGLCHVLVGFRTPIPSLKPCEKHGMIFSGALGVHSDVYIYISLSLACPWTQQSASQSNVASWEIPKGNGGVVRWESHIDFPSRARPCRFAGAQSLCQFYVWSPRFQELESKDWDFDCK